ncbi:unnamed protein product [Phytophthora lilii]|uniref:Unnamed protein product n=1 Tax=Phytophthora lilii TaxID=2077276 RepID=A0A9W6UC05_9STRA|nr:unnamed protein product [Phytophthora lilii]
MGYQNKIHDIAGDDNVWADLLSRWGSSFRTLCSIRQVSLPLSPHENFVWPAMKAIFEVQHDATPSQDIKRSTKDLLLRDERGRIYILDEAVDMQMRICVVGHFEIQTVQRANVVKLQQALERMHKRTATINSAVRAAGRKGHDKKQGTTMAQFDIGDFVLYADVWQHTRSKLRVNWCGPAQVVATTSNWMFEVRNLVTGQQKEVHVSRLKFYSDSSLASHSTQQ